MTDFAFDDPKPEGTNLHATRACSTCDGDRFVVVATRIDTYNGHSSEVEEYAPCPDCGGGIDTSFRRADGSTFRSPDPAKVRERLAQ